MCRLNYTDLLSLVIDYDIETIQNYLKELSRQKQAKAGIEITDATPEMTTAFFKGGR